MTEEQNVRIDSTSLTTTPLGPSVPGIELIGRLMLAISLGAALSLLALFFVPKQPEIAPIAIIILVLTNVGLVLLSFQVHKVLRVSGEKTTFIGWWRHGSTDKTRRPHIRVALNIASFFYFIGACILIQQWWEGVRDWDSLTPGLGPLVFGIMFYFFVVAIWRHTDSKLDRLLGHDLGIGLIVVLAGVLYIASLWLMPMLIVMLNEGLVAP